MALGALRGEEGLDPPAADLAELEMPEPPSRGSGAPTRLCSSWDRACGVSRGRNERRPAVRDPDSPAPDPASPRGGHQAKPRKDSLSQRTGFTVTPLNFRSPCVSATGTCGSASKASNVICGGSRHRSVLSFAGDPTGIRGRLGPSRRVDSARESRHCEPRSQDPAVGHH